MKYSAAKNSRLLMAICREEKCGRVVECVIWIPTVGNAGRKLYFVVTLLRH